MTDAHMLHRAAANGRPGA